MKTIKDSFLLCALVFIFSLASGYTLKAAVTITPKDSVVNTPVAGKTFAAMSKDNKTVTINWSVAQAQGTRKFIIERSSNGHMFYPIGELSPTASVNMRNYNFTDGAPLPGFNFYRLKQLDVNGNTGITGVSFVDMDIKSDLLLQNDEKKELLSAQYLTEESSEISIVVTNSAGKVIFRNTMSAKKGENPFMIFTKEMSKGQYYLSVTSPANKNTVGFVK